MTAVPLMSQTYKFTHWFEISRPPWTQEIWVLWVNGSRKRYGPRSSLSKESSASATSGMRCSPIQMTGRCVKNNVIGSLNLFTASEASFNLPLTCPPKILANSYRGVGVSFELGEARHLKQGLRATRPKTFDFYVYQVRRTNT